MTSRQLLLALLLVGVASIGWVAWLTTPATPPITAAAPPVRAPLPSPTNDTAAAIPTDLLPVEVAIGRQLSAILLPDGTGQLPAIEQTRAEIGIARISAEDWAEYQAWLASGASHGGPATALALASVVEWLAAPLQPAPGHLLVGPLAVPPADAYLLLVDAPASQQIYLSVVSAPADSAAPLSAGRLQPSAYTGLRLQPQGPAGQVADVYLRRVAAEGESALETQGWLHLLNQRAPALAAALVGDSPLRLVAGETQELLPWPADTGVELRSSAGDTSLELPLQAERITSASLDLAQLTATLTLEGQLLTRNGEPVSAAISTLGGQRTMSDAEGRFQLPGIAATTASTLFIDRLAPLAESTPDPLAEVLPQQLHLEFDPALAEPVTAGVVRQQWRLPGYVWLVLTDPPATEGQAEGEYPLFQLQRWEGDAGWQTVATTPFRSTPEGLAAGVNAAGRYRLEVATSPLSQRWSAPAELSLDSGTVTTQLLANTTALRHQLELHQGGRVLADMPLEVLAGNGLPPVELRTDSSGRLQLPPTGLETIYLQIRGEERQIALDPSGVTRVEMGGEALR